MKPKTKAGPAGTESAKQKHKTCTDSTTQEQSFKTCALCWLPAPKSVVTRSVDNRHIHVCRKCDCLLDQTKDVQLENLHQRVEAFFRMGVTK